MVLALAAYRAARAVALDSITEGFRQTIEDRTIGSRWAKLGELVTCGFCVSFWTAGITYLVWLLSTSRWSEQSALEHGIMWWAIAGAACFVIALDSYLMRDAPP